MTSGHVGRMPAGLVEERTREMSTFPTKILLATDASQDATKAAQLASDIANISDSELHVLHIGNMKDFHVAPGRSEEHTSELQSRQYLVCRLLLEKKTTVPQHT